MKKNKDISLNTSSDKKVKIKVLKSSNVDDLTKNKSKISSEDFKRIFFLYIQWWNLLSRTTYAYVGTYLCLQAIKNLVSRKVIFSIFKIFATETKTSFFSSEIVVFFSRLLSLIIFFTLKGLVFSVDGVISSWLKAPFGQISFSINKSKIDDDVSDELMILITEINEHFKETFKKFGVYNLTDVLQFFFFFSPKESIVKMIHGFDLLTTISYFVPLSIAWNRVAKLEKILKKIELEDE